MALIIRIDVDRPYGCSPLLRHLCSRLAADLWFPRIGRLGYLAELARMLAWLNGCRAPAHVFFRACTLPTRPVLDLLDRGRHAPGLHLEDSRSHDSFLAEKRRLEQHLGREVHALSKHGSGTVRQGRRHHAPYEPERYVDWAAHSGMRLFLGNLEDPALPEYRHHGVRVFPAAFWLEPHWRDTPRFPVAWLAAQARERDVVLLVHPENVWADPQLTAAFHRLTSELPATLAA